MTPTANRVRLGVALPSRSVKGGLDRLDGLIKSLYIGCGAFLGANARFWLGEWLRAKLDTVFPWQTLVVNASGSLLIGAVLEIAYRGSWNPGWRLFAAVGVLGGYTTFSSFSHETVDLLGKGSYGRAAGYIAGSIVLCIVGAWLGRGIARAFLGN